MLPCDSATLATLLPCQHTKLKEKNNADLNYIRQNPDEVKARLVDLNTEAPIDEILQLDQQRRDLLKEVETLRQERNSGSKAIGQLMREGKKAEAEAQKQRMTEVGDKISQLDETLRQVL